MARRSPLPAAALISAALALGLFLVAGGISRAPRQADLALNAAGKASTPAQTLPPAALAFEPSADGKGYLVRGAQYELGVDAGGTRLHGQGGDIRTRLVGARASDPAASQRQKLVVNRYHGAKSDWRSGIPTFGRVTYPGVYRGIDLAYHGKAGALEYDFIVRPGADPGRIQVAVSGAQRVRIDRGGNLVATDDNATFRQHRPVAYQVIAGTRRIVDARFVLDGNRARFALGRYDKTRPLVIDPTLTYGDYIGGAKDDSATRVAVDSSGNIYVVGSTKSTSIPNTSGTRSSTTNYDAYVLRIAPDHTRQWITYLGGSSDDAGNDIGLDSQGRPYIVGTTRSNDFSDGLFGPQDSFTAALGTNGSLRSAHTLGTQDSVATHLYSTAASIAVEGGGVAYIALSGQNTDPATQTAPTYTTGFVIRYPTSGVWDAAWGVDGDGVSVGPGTIGTGTVSAVGVKPGCASDCDVFYTGSVTHTFSCGNPATPTDQKVGYVGAYNFGSQTNPWGDSTFNFYREECAAGGSAVPIALDVTNHGDPVIVGQAQLADTATKAHVFFARYAGSNGWFDPLPFGASTEAASGGYDVTHDAQDNLIFVGFDSAKTGDLQGAIQSDYNGGFSDGTVLKVFPDGPAITSDPGGSTPHEAAAIIFATLYGGSATDQATGVASDGNGSIFLVGSTISISKFPTQNPTQATQVAGALGDGFIGIIRPTLAQITGGPSGTTHSRDAKFTFSAGPESGFDHSAEEVGAKFECKLSPRDSGFGACPANGYSGLGDGSYKFEVRAVDVGGTNGGSASREFQVDATLTPRFSIAPNPALVGRPVTFDASASTGLPITRYEWDLDGNGSFETDTGGTATATQTYPSAGSFNVGLRVTDSEGHTATTTNALQVNNATGPGTQFGVTINNGAQFTNDPNVTVTSTFPSFTSGLLFSNDGGFGKAQTFAAKKDTPWKLDSSGPERLPKTIYVRFLTGSISSNSFQDDIILDETPPKVDTAEIDPVGAEGSDAGDARAAKLRKYKVKMKARDKTSGVSKVQVTASKRKPGKALKYKRKFTVKSAKRPKWVRARDRAGNWSKWKKAR